MQYVWHPCIIYYFSYLYILVFDNNKNYIIMYNNTYKNNKAFKYASKC